MNGEVFQYPIVKKVGVVGEFSLEGGMAPSPLTIAAF